MNNKLQVWWIPQIPMKPFLIEVKTLLEAHLLIETLAAYDMFQFKNRIKPDYSNAGGLQLFDNGEWSDWYDEKTGEDFDEYREARKNDFPPIQFFSK